MNYIAKNLQAINDSVNLTNTRVIAVSKYYGTEEIITAYDAGIRDFAESKVQDSLKKISALPNEISSNIVWHFIGHLQSNKANKIVGKFNYIHSVDSLKIAKVVSEAASSIGIVQNILLQVRISPEETKFGFEPDELETCLEEILNLEGTNVCGLMMIASNTIDEKILHSEFIKLRDLRYYFEHKLNCNLPELSMGMSNDYQIAVEEGSTMIRVGQLLFKR